MAIPATPAGPVVDEPIRPSVAWFWIGGGLIVASAVAAVVWFVLGFLRLDDTIDGFERVPADVGGTVELDAGEYVIYEEGGGAGSLRFASAVQVTGPDGAPVPTAPYVSDLTYDFNGRDGVASATFTAPTDGSYEIDVGAVGDPSGFGPATLAVGTSVGGTLVWAILGGFLIGGFGAVVGIIILIITGTRRSRAKRERQRAMQGLAPQQPWRPPATPAPPPPVGAPLPPPAQPPPPTRAEPPAPVDPPPRNPDPPPPPGWTAP